MHHSNAMRCKGCGYDLHGLTQHRCPECGKTFNPHDRSTYLYRPVSGRGPLVLAISGVTLLMMPLLAPLALKTQTFLGPFILLFLIGSFLLLIAWYTTLPAVRGMRPWITHRRELITAHVMSATVCGLFLLYGVIRALKDWLT